MHIAFIHAKKPRDAEDTMRRVARDLRTQGFRLSGVLLNPCNQPARHACDMDLIDLATGSRIHISQNLGAGSTGCRLDAAAIEAVSMTVKAGMGAATPDVLILNRFGKQEAKGRGFHPVIVSALEGGIPVLVGVSELNRPAFESFAAGLAIQLPNSSSAVLYWISQFLHQNAA